MKRVVMDCFQLRVKAGNDGQRAALRSRRWEMRDCDGGCGAVPLAAAVERRRRRGPKGKRLRVGPFAHQAQAIACACFGHQPQTKSSFTVFGHQPQEHTRTHSVTECMGQSCTFLNRLWVHIPKNKTQHTRPFVPNSCSPLVKRVLRFAGSFARVCLLWMSSRRGAAGCAWVACAAACCGALPLKMRVAVSATAKAHTSLRFTPQPEQQ